MIEERRPVSTSSAAATSGRILDAFSGPIPRFRLRFFYGLGMLIVTCAMVLLPLAYLGLIGLVGYGVYYHAVEHAWMVNDGQGSMRVRAAAIVLYFVPFLIGPFIVGFMLKPIFARYPDDRFPLTLDRSQEPLLYAVMEKLCEAVCVPMPRVIEVDCNINAAAALRGGLFGIFSQDLRLIIGLPLAAGLPMREFIGVIAHELGHFSQRFGLRLSYIAGSINYWFERVVYERDAWDLWLVDTATDPNHRIGFVLHLARFGIWMNRRVLWILMVVGHCICSAFGRQMEYDADRVSSDVVGAAACRGGLITANYLAAGEAWAYRDLTNCWREKRLPDSLPMLIVSRANELSTEQRNDIVRRAMTHRTGLIDWHPSLARRIAAIERRNSPGVFAYDAPATALFANFRMIANAVTVAWYRRGSGVDIDSKGLFPTEDLIKQNAKTNKDAASSQRYFASCYHMSLPPLPTTDSIGPAIDPRVSIARLRKIRSQFDAAASNYGRLFEEYRAAQSRLTALHVSDVLLGAGFRKLDKPLLGIAKSNSMAIVAARAEVKATLDQLTPKLTSMVRLQRNRLTTALELACVPTVADKLRLEESPFEEIAKLLPILLRVEQHLPTMPHVSRELAAASALVENAPDRDVDEVFPKLIPTIQRIARESRATVETIRYSFEGINYPFEHARGRVTVAEYLATAVVQHQDFVATLYAASETLDRLIALHHRCLGRLAHIAERVERALGMPAVEIKPSSTSDEHAAA